MLRFAFACFVLVASIAPVAADEPKLTADDAKYLDKLLADFLFDPTGAERVTGDFLRPRRDRAESRDGWLVRGKEGKGNRVFFTDGDSVPAPDGLIGADFVKVCQARYAPRPAKLTREELEDREQRSAGVNAEADLTLAAWLHKLGHDELAAKALVAARKEAYMSAGFWRRADPRELLCQQLADVVYRDLRSAYTDRHDEAALAFGTKLFKLYGEVLQPGHREFWQAESIVADLHRRKKAGTFGNEVHRLGQEELPDDPAKRVAAVIAALEDLNAPAVNNQLRRHHHFDDLREDWRVQALIQVGEPAIPALLDAFEKDNRRTRYFQHPSVREPLLIAIEDILRVRIVERLSDPEYLCYNGQDDKVKEAAAQLRAYWNTFGKFPFDERMMKVLLDPNSRGRISAQAARHLASLNSDSNSCWLPKLFGNRVIAKFSNPTAAEAMLAARDRHWKAIASGIETSPTDDWRQSHPNDYLRLLVWLGDRRIVPTLAKLAETETDLLSRLWLASAANDMGESKPLEAIAKELETGTLKVRPFVLSVSDQRRTNAWLRGSIGELAAVICELSCTTTPFADRALWALANPNHPHHRATVALLVRHSSGGNDEDTLFRHPYWIGVAQQALTDTAPTGRTYKFERGRIIFEEERLRDFAGFPRELMKPEFRREEAAERVCDRLAMKLHGSIFGVPAFHVLRFDSETQLAAVAEFVGRYDRRFRALTRGEERGLDMRGLRGYDFIPDIKPLNRVATFADVISGDAMFHLNGKGKRTCVALPAWVTLEDGSRGLAFQAEIGPGDAVMYGVLFKDGIRAVPAAEVGSIEAVGKGAGMTPERIHGGIY